MTASPEMLQLMLWDGAIRFAEQGKEAILKKDIEGSYNTLLRSQKIVMEMITSLRHDVSPELCGKLSALYNFMYRRLVDANLKKDAKLVDDALEIMRHQRETWVLLIEQVAEERSTTARETANENADAIEASALVSEAAQSVALPVAGSVPSGRRNAYSNLALKPQRANHPGLSVQG